MMSALGLKENLWVSFLHSDNGHFHVHLIASRISKDGHRLNKLWHDQTIRDRVAREIEIRHHLIRDNGLHRIDEDGQIVEVPKNERERRKGLKSIKTDRAQTVEIHAGEKTFQSWAEEMRIGDRLKYAKSWKELHSTAAAYGCAIKQKGAGFMICPIEGKGGMQLSRVGLKGLVARFGPFEPGRERQASANAQYEPAPVNPKAASRYEKWRAAKRDFLPFKTEELQRLRSEHKAIRESLRGEQRQELAQLRASIAGADKFAAISLLKMQHAVQMTELATRFKHERTALYQELAEKAPGSTFRDYLIRESRKGDDVALGFVQAHASTHATDLSRKQEAKKLKIIAAIRGEEYLVVRRLQFSHHIEPSGSVVYHLGDDRQITDSALSRRVELNAPAAHDPEAIATALRFAASKFGPELTLTGPEDFQRRAVEIAVKERLGVKFTNPALKAYQDHLLAAAQMRPTPTKPAEQAAPVFHVAGAQVGLNARSWAEDLARTTGKKIVGLPAGGKAVYTVLHVTEDGVVLNLGRSIAVHPPIVSPTLAVGDMVTLQRDGRILLQQKSPGLGR